PPKIDLEETVPRGIEALSEERILRGAGENVRHTPPIDQDLGRLPETGNPDCLSRKAGGRRLPEATGSEKGEPRHDRGTDRRGPLRRSVTRRRLLLLERVACGC